MGDIYHWQCKQTIPVISRNRGTITDASAEVIDKLSVSNQRELLDAYFGKGGINYNIIRTSNHSADFGSGSHTYIEEEDEELSTFSIKKDKEFRIPMITQVLNMIGENADLC